MRATTILSLFAAALLVGGCMTGGGPDETRAPLEKVEKADYTNGVMWLEPGAERPVTEAELAEDVRANPVRIEFHADLATAWYAPDGEARYGKHNLMAVWRVWEHTADPEPIADDVAPDGSEDSESYSTPDRSLDAPDLVVDSEGPATTPDVETTQVELPFAVLEWRDRFRGRLTDELINSLDEAHPGCI